uniref:Uncharacterized protein n=1 Tax=Acrobeloides nanus TaxID=290746 RepID=A0A914D588_9BILA
MKEFGAAIVRMHEIGTGKREIGRLLGIDESTRNATTKVNSTRKLKKALKKAWKEINLETLIKTVDEFPKRLEACIAANGGYFE